MIDRTKSVLLVNVEELYLGREEYSSSCEVRVSQKVETRLYSAGGGRSEVLVSATVGSLTERDIGYVVGGGGGAEEGGGEEGDEGLRERLT
jgi:hypothetical protein